MSKVTTNRITKDQILGFHSTLVMTIAALIKQRSNVNAEPLFSSPPKGKEEENKPTTKELGSGMKLTSIRHLRRSMLNRKGHSLPYWTQKLTY